MKIIFMVVGKTSTEYIRTGIKVYESRIPHYIPFEIKEITDVRPGKTQDTERQKELEGAAILKEINGADHLCLLDERGKEFTSREFAGFINSKMINLPARLVFVVGGPYGFSRAVYDRADSKLSFSKMTFPHEMIRLFFVEQVYRAMTILRGEPYHHD